MDIADTVRSSFGALLESEGLQVLLGLIVIQLLLQSPAMIPSSGIVTMILGIVVLIAGFAAMLVYPIGALRTLNEGRFTLEHFSQNSVRPAIKSVGVSLTSSVLALVPAYLLMLPVILILVMGTLGPALAGGGLGATTLATGGLLSQLSGPMMALVVLLLFLALTWITYVFLSLLLSLPYLAVEDRRLFESMDQSVQTVIGNRFAMFAALIPFIIAYIAFGVGAGFLPRQGMIPVAYSVLGSSVMGTIMFSYLNQFHKRLG